MGIVHGAFSECSNELPGLYVEADDTSILEFLQRETFGSGLSKNLLLKFEIESDDFFSYSWFFFKVGVQLRLKVFIFSQLVTFEVQKTKPREYATVKSMWMVKIAIAVFLERGI